MSTASKPLEPSDKAMTLLSFRKFKEEWEQYCAEISKLSLNRSECTDKRAHMKGVLQAFEIDLMTKERTKLEMKSLASFGMSLDNALSAASNNYRQQILVPRWSWPTITLATVSALAAIANVIILYYLLKK